MKQQQGAALVIVMALLAGALMLGMSGMQSALIDERLAGNYRASVQARMNAEIAAAEALDDNGLIFLNSTHSLSDLLELSWDELNGQFSVNQNALNFSCDRDGQFECVYIPLALDNGSYVIAKGIVGSTQRGRAESKAILLRYVADGEMQQPFGSAITSCQDITLRGSARIVGGVVAGNNLIIDGNPPPPDSASVGGSIVYPNWWGNQHQQRVENYQSGDDGYRFTESCDSLGILDDDENDRSYFERMASALDVMGAGQWLQEQGLEHYYQENNNAFTFTGGSGSQDASTSYLGETGRETSLNIDKDLKTSGRLQRLVVDGTVNLFVDGDFDLGGNTSLEISEGAILNLYVSGKVTLSAGSKLALNSENFMRQDSTGIDRPAVSIYSTYQQIDSRSGITIGGSNDTYAAIYAPGSNVDIGGSGALYGGLRAQNIVMSGAGALEYVADLADYEVSGGGAGGGPPSFSKWVEEL